MKKINCTTKMEVSVILEYGIDFQDEDIDKNVFGTPLNEIKADSLRRIAKENGFDDWTFNSYIKDNKTNAIFYKILK